MNKIKLVRLWHRIRLIKLPSPLQTLRQRITALVKQRGKVVGWSALADHTTLGKQQVELARQGGIAGVGIAAPGRHGISQIHPGRQRAEQFEQSALHPVGAVKNRTRPQRNAAGALQKQRPHNGCCAPSANGTCLLSAGIRNYLDRILHDIVGQLLKKLQIIIGEIGIVIQYDSDSLHPTFSGIPGYIV